ncbi:MAG: hypothetical protein AAB414_00650 [Patescibacteria group bacterium]
MPEEQTGDVKPQAATPDQPLTVRIETEREPYEVKIPAVSHLFSDIDRYNQQFSMGAMMARSLFSVVRFEDDDEPRAPDSLGREEDHQKMTASALAVIHKDTLDKIGLSLEPVSGKGATLMVLGQQAGEGQMRINVSNRNRFVSFLGALEPELVEQTGLKQNLEGLSAVLVQQVLDNYDLQEPTDEALQLLGGLGNIVDQYNRLGMERAVNRLETYLQHARQGDLREYVAIERRALLSEPGQNFGPADWPIDTTPEGLEGRWNEALAILRAAKENPKAHELYQQLADHLTKCIKIAREYVKQKGDRPLLGDVLEKEHMRLEDITLS